MTINWNPKNENCEHANVSWIIETLTQNIRRYCYVQRVSWGLRMPYSACVFPADQTGDLTSWATGMASSVHLFVRTIHWIIRTLEWPELQEDTTVFHIWNQYLIKTEWHCTGFETRQRQMLGGPRLHLFSVR